CLLVMTVLDQVIRGLLGTRGGITPTPACPGGQTGNLPRARFVAHQGTARHARGPPVRYRDNPDPVPKRGPFSMPIKGPDCVPFDTPGCALRGRPRLVGIRRI